MSPRREQPKALFAVLRIDLFHGERLTPENANYVVTVKEVLPDEDAAQAEAERLNGLARQRGIESFYVVQLARYYEGPAASG